MLNLTDVFRKIRPFSLDSFEDVGDILQYLLPWGALLAIALNGDITAAQQWLIAGVANSLLTVLFKFLFNFTPLGRRPNGDMESFPSGHTSTAFYGAAVFHVYFGLIAAIVPYLLAAVTGYSRIYAKKHWLRDVIAGAALAIGIVFVVYY